MISRRGRVECVAINPITKAEQNLVHLLKSSPSLHCFSDALSLLSLSSLYSLPPYWYFLCYSSGSKSRSSNGDKNLSTGGSSHFTSVIFVTSISVTVTDPAKISAVIDIGCNQLYPLVPPYPKILYPMIKIVLSLPEYPKIGNYIVRLYI